MKRFITAIVIVFLFSSTALAFKAGEWKNLPEQSKFFYVVGVLEAWTNLKAAVDFTRQQNERAMTPAEGIFVDMVVCMNGRNMTNQQVYDTVDKYVSNRPDSHGYLMSGVVWSALSEVCKK
ncbi:MAG: hypothetical protein LLF28_08670 [Nitrospiraceae bacterium]|nr:hypothetical protein [Nitrospiraceae bacterium]